MNDENRWLQAPNKPGWWWYLRLGDNFEQGTTSLSTLFVTPHHNKKQELAVQVGDIFFGVVPDYGAIGLEFDGTPAGEWGMWYGPISPPKPPHGIEYHTLKYLNKTINEYKPIPKLI